MWSNIIGAIILMAYYLIVCVLLPTILKVWVGVPTEIVRKTQHIAYSLSIFLLLRLFDTWYVAIIAAFSLVVLGYPVLLVVEKFRRYREFFVDRTPRGGELRMQLLYGFGDAAAALVGKSFGRNFVVNRFIEGSKAYEGTGAMIIAAFLALFFTLLLYAGKPWYISLFVSLVVAPICAVVELFSRSGTDTLTVPLSVALMVLPLMHLFSYLGL
ncbi:MAG: hypothetical protein Q8S19_02445 [Bacillota bacterium]|nr:hypothetical protein [Bacillota bacterium]